MFFTMQDSMGHQKFESKVSYRVLGDKGLRSCASGVPDIKDLLRPQVAERCVIILENSMCSERGLHKSSGSPHSEVGTPKASQTTSTQLAAVEFYCSQESRPFKSPEGCAKACGMPGEYLHFPTYN